MNKPFTFVMYQIETPNKDFFVKNSKQQDSDEEEQHKKEYPNAFIIKKSNETLTLIDIHERFPWDRIRGTGINKKNCQFYCKIKQICDITTVDVWLHLKELHQAVALYEGANTVYLKLVAI